MLDEIKKHPYVLGGAVLGIIVLFFILSSGSSTSTTTSAGDSSSDVAAAEASQNAQLAAQTQIAGIAGSEAISANNNAASISVATIQGHTADNANDLSAAVAAQQINAEEDVTNTANTLTAQTTQFLAGQQTQQLAISTASQEHQTDSLIAGLISESQISAGVANNASNNAAATAQQSWFSKIF